MGTNSAVPDPVRCTGFGPRAVRRPKPLSQRSAHEINDGRPPDTTLTSNASCTKDANNFDEDLIEEVNEDDASIREPEDVFAEEKLSYQNLKVDDRSDALEELEEELRSLDEMENDICNLFAAAEHTPHVKMVKRKTASQQKNLSREATPSFSSSYGADDCFGYISSPSIDPSELCTIVLRHPVSGTGCPVAYMFTNDHSMAAVAVFLRFVKQDIGVASLEKITIDVSATEHAAITAVYPEATIQWCLFHVNRAWMGKIRELAKLGSTALNHQAHREIITGSKALMWEKNQETFLLKLLAFYTKYSQYPKFLNYMDRTYLNREKFVHWSSALQPQVYSNMETNNFVERWHNQLKATYLGRKRNRRVDRLIYILVKDVEPDYIQNINRITLNAGRKGPEERRRRRRQLTAESINEAILSTMIRAPEEENGPYTIQSFTDYNHFYEVAVANQEMKAFPFNLSKPSIARHESTRSETNPFSSKTHSFNMISNVDAVFNAFKRNPREFTDEQTTLFLSSGSVSSCSNTNTSSSSNTLPSELSLSDDQHSSLNITATIFMDNHQDQDSTEVGIKRNHDETLLPDTVSFEPPQGDRLTVRDFDVSEALYQRQFSLKKYKYKLSLEDHLHVIMASASILLLTPYKYPDELKPFIQHDNWLATIKLIQNTYKINRLSMPVNTVANMLATSDQLVTGIISRKGAVYAIDSFITISARVHVCCGIVLLDPQTSTLDHRRRHE
ncbi:hypothetical protein [Parasitella parasitica]|uniref:Uncharacterized protein n=1 Tax=Parasitella parasitica TaxID=35722 RepID=A0A0B7NXG9_9FUNG|nr:hypothetical protein [Parasitella parasitica]